MRRWLVLAAIACLGADVRIVRGDLEIVFQSAQDALEAAHPFDVLELGPGYHPGPLRIGDVDDLDIRGGGRARIGLEAPVTWSPIEGEPGHYRATGFSSFTILRANGLKVLFARDRAMYDANVADGIAVALREGSFTRLWLEEEDPRQEQLQIASSNAAAVVCERSARLKLEGLVIGPAWRGIQAGGDCPGLEVDQTRVYGATFGLSGPTRDAVIRRSEFDGRLDTRWCYRDVKSNRAMEGGAIDLLGERVRVLENVVRRIDNGIGFVCPAPCQALEPRVEGNYLVDLHDDAIELDGPLVGGVFRQNRQDRTFVSLSMSPRLGSGIARFERNVLDATFQHACFDRSGATSGAPQVTKFNGFQARDLAFVRNTLQALGHAIRGAVAAGGPYPARLEWRANDVRSRFGPLVRFPGTAAAGNVFQGNAYALEVPAPNAIVAWNQPEQPSPPGFPVNYPSLEAAKASSFGVAAGWETEPLGAVGAFDVGSTVQVSSTERLFTGWQLRRGNGFRPDAPELAGWVVVSTELAMRYDPPPSAPVLLEVELLSP